MALYHINAPNANFERLIEAQGFHFEQITQDDNGAHNHFKPHRIFDVSINELTSGNGLIDPKQTGWRYIVKDKKEIDHIVEIHGENDLDSHQLNHINSGLRVSSFLEIYQEVLSDEDVIANDYEVCALRINELFLLVVWVRGIDHDHEFYIPTFPVAHDFQAGHKYSYNEFNQLIQKVACSTAGIEIQATKDDLTIIEGIGPKIALLLDRKGINSFEALANTDVTDLNRLLDESGRSFNTAKPETWPEQARLAADGEWDKLNGLMKVLKGGKR